MGVSFDVFDIFSLLASLIWVIELGKFLFLTSLSTGLRFHPGFYWHLCWALQDIEKFTDGLEESTNARPNSSSLRTTEFSTFQSRKTKDTWDGITGFHVPHLTISLLPFPQHFTVNSNFYHKKRMRVLRARANYFPKSYTSLSQYLLQRHNHPIPILLRLPLKGYFTLSWNGFLNWAL